ncbi:MAG TPA: tryptophan 2,3-dioxygenase family protein [bacterium]|nr:tryptophan 2,3-dioxygenase family protein [bacterium]
MPSSPETLRWLEKLEEKYAADGQDTAGYLEGHYYRRYVNYWDYVRLDTLLSLQTPLTDIPDERIFIIYHQITELYFKLCLHEYEQIGFNEGMTGAELLTRVQRINRYFEHLTSSFDVMVDGMDKKQFLQFRMALMPASGFQSAQYRLIEIASTPLLNLTDKERRKALGESSPHEDMLACLYWRAGATLEDSGVKTLTLLQFEEKYAPLLHEHARKYQGHTLWEAYQRLSEADRQNPRLIRQLRALDANVNVNWPLVHFKSAVRYLTRDPDAIAATGGTNWRQYLPPKFQRRIFFPELWSEQELEEWGKGWVDNVLGEQAPPRS